MVDRDHQAARRAHPRHLRRADRRGYTEYKAITTQNADGYYGWEEEAPFDKIIVTCGIDHIPPPLLQQLKPDGIMVIPVGPPGAQHVLKVVKQPGADGAFTVARSDIYGGKSCSFVPFTKLDGDGHQRHPQREVSQSSNFLVSQFRSSPVFAARSDANFEIKGTRANL